MSVLNSVNNLKNMMRNTTYLVIKFEAQFFVLCSIKKLQLENTKLIMFFNKQCKHNITPNYIQIKKNTTVQKQ